jgi:hypothetical protein
MRDGAPREPGRLIVRNEFGIVAVELHGDGDRQSLRIEDLRSGTSIELDALELECLAFARHEDLSSLLDPSRTRWSGEDRTPEG